MRAEERIRSAALAELARESADKQVAAPSSWIDLRGPLAHTIALLTALGVPLSVELCGAGAGKITCERISHFSCRRRAWRFRQRSKNLNMFTPCDDIAPRVATPPAATLEQRVRQRGCPRQRTKAESG
jgi:hypothetical protein